MFKVAILSCLVAVCLANTYNPYKPAAYKSGYDSYDLAPAKYNFNWAVKDDYTYNNFGQYEARDGHNTDGSYFVQLPDGRLQTVKYYVNGDSGYVAEVTYSGEPKYDASYEKPVYAPAPYKPAAYRPAPYYA